jgi:hypothetical protein
VDLPEFMMGEISKFENNNCPILTFGPDFPANTLFIISYKK